MSGVMVDRRDQVLITLRSPASFAASIFFCRWSSTNGPFFRLRGISLPPCPATAAAADDHLVGLLALLAGAALGLPPRRHRVATTRALALATTERVVDGVHGDATHVRALALPPVTPGLADLDEAGLAVADRADCAAAVDRDAPHLGGREAESGELAFLGHELDRRTGAPPELAARTGLELDVV